MPQRVFAASVTAVLLLLCLQPPRLAAADNVDPSGTWKWKREIEGNTSESVLKIKLDKDKLVGQYARGENKSEVKNGKVEGNEISFEIEGKYGDVEVKGKFNGKVEKDTITGKIALSSDAGSQELDWEAKRGLDYEDVLGKWQLRVESPDRVYEPVATFETDKEQKPAGMYVTQEIGEFKLEEISIKEADLLFKIVAERDGNKVTIAYTVRPAGDSMKGKVKLTFNENDFELDMTGKRVVEEKKDDKKEKPAETK